MEQIYGYQGKLYYKVGGGSGGAFVELKNCRKVKLNREYKEADVSTRGGGDVEQVEPVRATVSIDFEMIWDPSDTDFTALHAAWVARTPVGFKCLDSDESARGYLGDMKFHKFDRDEDDENVMIASCTIKPCRSAVVPSFAGPPATSET